MKKLLLSFIFIFWSLSAFGADTLIYFYSPTCKFCDKMNPVISEYQAKHKDIKVVSIDAIGDKEQAVKYEIKSFPTMVVLDKGKVIGKITGYKPLETLEAKIINPTIDEVKKPATLIDLKARVFDIIRQQEILQLEKQQILLEIQKQEAK